MNKEQGLKDHSGKQKRQGKATEAAAGELPETVLFLWSNYRTNNSKFHFRTNFSYFRLNRTTTTGARSAHLHKTLVVLQDQRFRSHLPSLVLGFVVCKQDLKIIYKLKIRNELAKGER